MGKTCRKCGETKPAAEFRANARMADGLSSWCAECHNAASRRWRDRQRELVAEALEARRREHLERLRKQTRESRERTDRLIRGKQHSATAIVECIAALSEATGTLRELQRRTWRTVA